MSYTVSAAFTSSYARWKRARRTADTSHTGRPASPGLTPRCRPDQLPPTPSFPLSSHRLQLPASPRRRWLMYYAYYLVTIAAFYVVRLPTVSPVPGVVYSSATLLCPRICTRSMNLMALVATLRLLKIARRSFPSGKWPSSRLRMSLSFLHIKRTCRTVWRPS